MTTNGQTDGALRSGVVTLVALSAIGWGLIIWSIASMSSPIVSLMMPATSQWAFREIIAVWLMWAVMMGAMMLPSAIPMILVHRRIAQKRDPGNPGASRWFLASYLLAWALFSLVAAFLQWGFQRTGLLSHMLQVQGPLASGSILVAAGIFQLTPLKAACLNTCRTPIGFLLTDWRPGRVGAFRMGFRHGQYCIGCCWALMLVLFIGGVMSLTTIALLSALVAMEKLAPRGEQIARLGGVLLTIWGLALMFGTLDGNGLR